MDTAPQAVTSSCYVPSAQVINTTLGEEMPTDVTGIFRPPVPSPQFHDRIERTAEFPKALS
ncbi:uncharacterized protein N7483_009634 [Penicillium malachiteum]|uniref:uncharacterized protein n=1 Tax=Penicillium malachiteum TaxID=1324776 RepID=UPI002547A5BE|nr:uncharacterized protein N7483_009634 [Penicillium malachiteum]KAJ5721700.1 hypothetical protein N7483_009634 [Penicillium malachiteum]